MFTATISRVSKHRDLVRVVPLVLWSMSRSFDPVRCFNPPFASASRMCDLQRTYVCGQDVKGIACTHARTSACTQGSRVQPTSREDMLEGPNGGGGSGAGPPPPSLIFKSVCVINHVQGGEQVFELFVVNLQERNLQLNVCVILFLQPPKPMTSSAPAPAYMH